MPQILDAERQILAYGVPEDTPEGLLLREIANKHSIEVKNIRLEDFGQKLGYLAGLKSYERTEKDYDGEAVKHSIIWFVNVTREELSSILQEYSLDKNTKSIDLKSVLTEYNVNWKLIDHYEELQKEHKMMQSYTFVFHAKSAFKNLDTNDYTKESLHALEEAIVKSDPVITQIQQGIEVNQDILDEHVREIRDAYQSLVPNIQ